MLLLLPLLAPAALDVLDVGPGAPHAQIDDAVLAANDGDVIRVAPGTYTSFAIRGKSLTVLGAPGVQVQGVVRVQELAPGQEVAVHRLRLRSLQGQFEERLIVGSNQGSVRLEDLDLAQESSTSPIGAGSLGGARVMSSADVTFVRCVLEPKTAYDSWFERQLGGSGLSCSQSSVALYGCAVKGAGNSGQGWPAHSAIAAHQCDLELLDVVARGGSSGDTYLTFAGNCRGWAGPGGDGVSASASIVTTIDCALQGGSGGYDGCASSPFVHADGQPMGLEAGATRTEGPGTAPMIDVPPSVGEGDPISLALTTDPGDLVFVLCSLGPDRAAFPGLFGALLIDASSAYRRVPIAGSGPLSTTLTAPHLPPFGTQDLHLQLVSLRADPAQGGSVVPVLGSPRVVTVLDGAW